MRRLFILFSPLPPLVTVGVYCHVLQFDPAPRYPPHCAPTLPKTVRHVTFSCRRELGQSLWSQQVLSVHSGPARLGVGDAPRDQSRVSYQGFNRGSVINLTTGQIKKKEKKKVKKEKERGVGGGWEEAAPSLCISVLICGHAVYFYLALLFSLPPLWLQEYQDAEGPATKLKWFYPETITFGSFFFFKEQQQQL